MSQTLKKSNRSLFRMHHALKVFGNRKMAAPDADMLVRRFLRLIGPFAEDIPAARQRVALDILEEYEDVDALSTLQIDKISARIALAQDEFDKQEIEITLPGVRLKKSDLPLREKGENGWQNAAGLGALTADLEELYEENVTDTPPAEEPVDEPAE